MKVHQMPLVPDRLPIDRPPPRPESEERLRSAFADIVALRVNPREEERKPPQRERSKERLPSQPGAPDEDAAPATGGTRIDLLT